MCVDIDIISAMDYNVSIVLEGLWLKVDASCGQNDPLKGSEYTF